MAARGRSPSPQSLQVRERVVAGGQGAGSGHRRWEAGSELQHLLDHLRGPPRFAELVVGHAEPHAGDRPQRRCAAGERRVEVLDRQLAVAAECLGGGLTGADNHWLTVRLEGRGPINRDAIGARVFVTPGDGRTRGRPRMQEVKSGSSLGAGNDTALHFGLGAAATAAVRVVWPDGTEAVFEDVAADRVRHVVYGQ